MPSGLSLMKTMEDEFAKLVFDPVAGPILQPSNKHEGATIDRTADSRPEMVDIDFWHPTDEQWFRYSSCMREVFEADDGQSGYGGGEHPERSKAAQYYPTKARFVEQDTGLVLATTDIDRQKIIDNAVPNMNDFRKPVNRKERRTMEQDIEHQRKVLGKKLDKRAVGKKVPDS